MKLSEIINLRDMIFKMIVENINYKYISIEDVSKIITHIDQIIEDQRQIQQTYYKKKKELIKNELKKSK